MTIFSKIIGAEIPCYKVAENDDFLAFLDINPFVEGHTLIIPKRVEIDKLFELPKDIYLGLMDFSQEVAVALEMVIPSKRIASMVLGMEIPHAHLHIMPINSEKDVLFPKKKKVSEERMKEIASLIGEAFRKNQG